MQQIPRQWWFYGAAAALAVALIGSLLLLRNQNTPSGFAAAADQTVTFTQPLTVSGLPTGCTAAISGATITVTCAPIGPPPATVQVQAETTTVSSGTISVTSTGDTGGGQKLESHTVGQTYDYVVPIAGAGTYMISARLGGNAGNTGTGTVHFEYPVGTNFSGPLSITSTAWQTITSSKTVSLPAGNATIRLVVDSLMSGQVAINWFQLDPSGVTPPPVTHSVKLNWTAGTVTNPPCVITSCPGPANCFGAATDYRVYRSQTSGSYQSPIASVPAPTTTYTDTAVTAGQTYYYKVTGYNANACTPESAAASEIKTVIPSTRALR